MTTDLDITKAIASAYKTMYEPKQEEVVVEETPTQEPAAEQEEVVQEAKAKLDPVGKEDDDVDNDGDTDAADKYLKKRRQAISKAIKKEKTEKTQKEDTDLTDAVNRVITGQDETLEVEAASQNEVIEQGKDSVCEEKYLDQKGKGESEDGYHDAGMFTKSKATQLSKKHRGSKVVKDPSGKYVVRLKEDYYAVQYYNKKGKPEESPATFKDERSAKKYHKKAMKAVKDGSYKMFKVKGRMESADLDESTKAYAASLEKIANDKKLKKISKKDRETLAKLADLMKNEGNAFTKALAAARLKGDDEFIVSGKKYRVEDYAHLNEGLVKGVRGKDGKVYSIELTKDGRKLAIRTKNQFGDINTLSLKQAMKIFEEKMEQVNEDGHDDVASMKNKVKVAVSALQKMEQELSKLPDDGSLPTWWTNKVAIAVDKLDGMADYLDTKVEVAEPEAKGEKEFKAKHKVKKTVAPSLKEGEFKPHMMYDPETGKGYKAEKPEDHERMSKMGYTHEKPKKVDEVEEPRAKGEKDFKDAHKVKKTVAPSLKA